MGTEKVSRNGSDSPSRAVAISCGGSCASTPQMMPGSSSPTGSCAPRALSSRVSRSRRGLHAPFPHGEGGGFPGPAAPFLPRSKGNGRDPEAPPVPDEALGYVRDYAASGSPSPSSFGLPKMARPSVSTCSPGRSTKRQSRPLCCSRYLSAYGLGSNAPGRRSREIMLATRARRPYSLAQPAASPRRQLHLRQAFPARQPQERESYRPGQHGQDSHGHAQDMPHGSLAPDSRP